MASVSIVLSSQEQLDRTKWSTWPLWKHIANLNLWPRYHKWNAFVNLCFPSAHWCLSIISIFGGSILYISTRFSCFFLSLSLSAAYVIDRTGHLGWCGVTIVGIKKKKTTQTYSLKNFTDIGVSAIWKSLYNNFCLHIYCVSANSPNRWWVGNF